MKLQRPLPSSATASAVTGETGGGLTEFLKNDDHHSTGDWLRRVRAVTVRSGQIYVSDGSYWNLKSPERGFRCAEKRLKKKKILKLTWKRKTKKKNRDFFFHQGPETVDLIISFGRRRVDGCQPDSGAFERKSRPTDLDASGIRSALRWLQNARRCAIIFAYFIFAGN